MTASGRDPRPGWRLEVAPSAGITARIVARILSVAVALALAALAIEASGRSAVAIAEAALVGTLGSANGREQAAILATPIILTGLSVALVLRIRAWNIGAEGQLFIGAWAATGVGLFFAGPEVLLLPAMLLAAVVCGALWMAIPALARAYAGTNEIITTLLLNPVAILVVNHFAIGPWRDRSVGTLSSSYRVPVELPTVLGGIPLGFLIAIGLAVVLSLALRRTVPGFELSIVGRNPRAAEFAGIDVKRVTLVVMLLGGAIAGAAGMIELAGTAHRLSGTVSNGYGYVGIIVAVLTAGSPILIVVVGYLFAVLLNAGIVLQTQGLSSSTVLAVTGAVLLLVAIGEVVARYRLVRGVGSPAVGPAAGEPEGAS